jgi:hypothetical protein
VSGRCAAQVLPSCGIVGSYCSVGPNPVDCCPGLSCVADSFGQMACALQ